jgi:hypothetical protein
LFPKRFHCEEFKTARLGYDPVQENFTGGYLATVAYFEEHGG